MSIKSRLLLASACGALLSTMTQAAVAAEGADNDVIEEVVVTGSRLKNANLVGTSPVSTISSEDIKFEGALNSEEFLAELPQVSAGIGATNTGNDSFGAAVVDLRNLGQNRTLVLINGTRGAPFSFRNSVDINSIPAALVKRVEVLTGSASVVYGADAVAGVVNFIMNDDFEGLQATATYEASEKGGANQYGANVAFGGKINDRGNISGSIGYTKRDELLAGDRAFSTSIYNDGGLSTQNPAGGNFSSAAGDFSFTDAGAFTTDSQAGDFNAGNTMIMPMERIDGSVFFNYEVSDSVEAYGRAMFSNSRLNSSLNPISYSGSFTVQDDNPYLTADILGQLAFDADGETTLSVKRTLAEFGHITRDTTRTNFQTQFGLRGDLTSNISWDSYVQYGRSDEQHIIGGEGIKARLAQAANATVDANGNAVCADTSNGCAPVNLFGAGTISQEAMDFIMVPMTRDRSREQLVAAAVLSGDTTDMFELPAGAVSWVAGVEYRDEKANEINDGLLMTGQSFTQGQRSGVDGGFDVKEIYGEVSVPLLKDLPFIEHLSVEGAYRHSDYSTAGGKNAWKLGANWKANDDIRFRGSYQSVVRAPNVGELYGAISGIPLSIFTNDTNTGRLVDPCSDPATTGADTAQCAAFGAPVAPYITDVGDAQFIYGGNPELKPETGKTLTLGAVVTPSAVPGLTLSVDYYDITVDGGLYVIFPWDAVDSCYITDPSANNPLCALVPRGDNGQINLGDVTDKNVSSFKVKGFDLAAKYSFDLSDSMPGNAVDLSYMATIVTGQSKQNSQFTDVIDCKGSFSSACKIDSRIQAAYRHNVTATWRADNVDVQLGWQAIGKVTDGDQSIGAQHYLDLAALYSVNDSVQVRAGIDNLLGKKPVIAGSNQEAFNTFPASYDVIGRTFGLSVTLKR